MNEILCEHCNQELHQIGPFASVKPEGQPAVKSGNEYEYQCLNEKCPAHEEIVTYSIEEVVSYHVRMTQVCECGHTQGMHGNSFSLIPEGGFKIPKERDHSCSVNDCGCKAVYTHQLNTL